jgi:hypothetical protein
VRRRSQRIQIPGFSTNPDAAIRTETALRPAPHTSSAPMSRHVVLIAALLCTVVALNTATGVPIYLFYFHCDFFIRFFFFFELLSFQ